MRQPQELRTLIAASTRYMLACQDRLSSEFRLGNWPRYDWSQVSRELVFSEDGSPKVVAEVEIVGSISSRSNTWLWSWANPSVNQSMVGAASKVRLYGEEHSLLHLTAESWPAEEADGWAMAAIAANLTSAEGVYRSPVDWGTAFLVMKNIRWAT